MIIVHIIEKYQAIKEIAITVNKFLFDQTFDSVVIMKTFVNVKHDENI